MRKNNQWGTTSLVKPLPVADIKGEPGSEQHKRSVLKLANSMYDYHLTGPYTFSSPSPEKAYRASGIRNTVIREYGYKPIAKPGGTQLKWMGVPEKHNMITPLVNPNYKAGMRLKRQIERESDLHETNLRVEAMHYKMMGDTYSQAQTNRKATELRKHYDDQLEKVYRRPVYFGELHRENEAAKKAGKKRLPHKLYEPFASNHKLYRKPRRKKQ